MKQPQVLLVLIVKRNHAERLLEMGDISAVDDGAGNGLGSPAGVPDKSGRIACHDILWGRDRVGGEIDDGFLRNPGGARTERRTSSLPEGTTGDNELLYYGRILDDGNGVVNCQTDGLELGG